MSAILSPNVRVSRNSPSSFFRRSAGDTGYDNLATNFHSSFPLDFLT